MKYELKYEIRPDFRKAGVLSRDTKYEYGNTI